MIDHIAQRCGRVLALLAGALMLAACSARPGPEVLAAAGESVPGARVVTVYVATTRERDAAGERFTAEPADQVNYAQFRISIPPDHKPGQIEWPAAGAAPNPARSFATLQQTALDEAAFRRSVASGRGAGRAAVFVHGFNYSFQEALFRLAQVAADAELDGTPVLFSWPSRASVTGYLADREAATYSRDQLARLLTTLTATHGPGQVTVLGHSMGGWLTIEAVRQLRLTGRDDVLKRLNVVLAAPDIDVDVFRAQLEVIGRLDPPMTILVSPDDVALSFSGFLAGEKKRVGSLNVMDPRVQEAAVKANVQVIDISKVSASDRLNHDRYVALAALYPRLAARNHGGGQEVRRAGAFVFNAVGAVIASPFNIAERVVGGE